MRYRWRFFEGAESGTREVEAKHCIAGGEVTDQGLESICCASEAMHQYHQWTSATFFNKNSRAIGCGIVIGLVFGHGHELEEELRR